MITQRTTIRNVFCTVSLLIVFTTSCFSQYFKELPVTYYYSSQDFIDGNVSPDTIIGIGVKKDKNVLIIPRLERSDKPRKSKKGSMAWAINYQDTCYLSLEYSRYLNGNNVFAQIDVKGRYCLIFFDKNSPKRLRSSVIEHSFVNGVLVSAIVTIANDGGVKFWEDLNGVKKGMIFVDTEHPDMESIYGVKNATCEALSPYLVTQICHNAYSKKEIREMTFEQVVDVIVKENEKWFNK